MKLSRRQWFSHFALPVLGSPAAAFGYASLVEKHQSTVTRADIPLRNEHAELDGLRIGVMGDFHHDDFGNNDLVRRMVERVNREKVDLVILVGDYTSEDPRALGPLCRELRRLRPRLGSFAVQGNHDCWHPDTNLSARLGDSGISLLTNEIVEFARFALVGLDSAWGGQPDAEGTLARVPPNKPILLAWHEPDPFDSLHDDRLVLQVSGHTHGGQVCAPLFGPILLPLYGKKYPWGHYQKEGSSLFVTRGVGTLSVPARFLCPPEVALLTLRNNPA